MSEGRKRWIVRLLALVGLLAGLGAALHPWLLSWGIPLVLRSQGLDVRNARVANYRTLVFHGLAGEVGQVSLEAGRLQLRNPLFLLADRVLGRDVGEPAFVLSEWVLRLPEAAPPAKRAEAGPAFLEVIQGLSLVDGFVQVLEGYDTAARWAPRARVEAGRVDAGDRRFRVSRVDWAEKRLIAEGRWDEREQSGRLIVDRVDRGLEAEFNLAPGLLDLDTELLLNDRELELKGQGTLLGGPLVLQGVFSPGQPWPDRLRLAWREPDSAWLGKQFPGLEPGKQNLVVEIHRTDWSMDWSGEGLYRRASAASGAPEALQIPWRFALVASGNEQAASLDRFRFDSSPLRLSIEQPVSLDFSPLEFSRPLAIRGEFFPGEAGIRQALGEATLSGELTLEGSMSEPAYALTLRGDGWPLGGLGPLAFALSLEGAGWDAGEARAELSAPAGSLQVRGKPSLNPDEPRASMLFEQIEMRAAEGPALRLESPAALVVRFGADRRPEALELPHGLNLVEPGKPAAGARLRLGPTAYVPGQFPQLSEVELQGLRASWIQPWIPVELPPARVDSLRLRLDGGSWEGAELTLDGAWTAPLAGPLAVRGAVRAGAEGLRLETFVIEGENGLRMETQGTFPLEITGGRGERPVFRLDPRGRFALAGSARSGEGMPPLETDAFSLSGEGVSFTWDLEGSWEAPRGTVQSEGRRLAWKRPGQEQPIVATDWDLVASADDRRIRLAADKLSVLDTDLSFEALLPGDADIWSAIRAGDLDTLLREVEATLSTASMQMAQLDPLLPDAFQRQGSAQIDLDYAFERGLSGVVRLEGLGTHVSTGGYGISNIRGDLVFQGDSGSFDGLRADFNGRPVDLGGEWTWNYREAEAPRFRLTANGEDIPIVRQSNVLLRSDLDLVLERAGMDQPVVLSGSARLKDGLFLRNFINFVQPGTASVAQRPPYFSITAAPFGDWELDVAIEGEDFMRINSTVVKGVLSTELTLDGTLANPFLLGNIWATEGTLVFPYGRLRLENAQAEFPVERPYDPSISASGKATTQGYDITLDLAGTLETPEIDFSSDPNLSTDEIVLLLTAGVLPEAGGANDFTQTSGRLALYLGQGYLGEILGPSAPGRLRLESGEELSAEGRETYTVEFDLSEDISLVGEYDKYDDYNLDIRWKFRSAK